MKGVKLRQGFAIALMAGAGLAQAAECLIEPMQTVEVASSVPGVVMTLGAQRGDRVKRGQVLVTLDDRAESEVIGPPAPKIVPKKHVA
ncbi:MAG: biotin/lipoyl-binding protein [Hydrogenophaga sp.]|nr:biotin/lipoyl-binding protein [Hydrogenophaga sp.]MDP3925189.1 biotin/lipoyl-binding protein [Hydrogenophaga sp.]MDZ4128692.1 biotin/lipoyl-binding protein [Hydrogenophaga sp.]MDZ4239528.1 biotin/lipoyl-binding protein [Hydrogenophaga sp.]